MARKLSAKPPDWLTALREGVPDVYLRVADDVWANRDAFIKWPSRPLLFMPGTVRGVTKYHSYSAEEIDQIRATGARPDTLSNGPAVMAFRVAGGLRPRRAAGRKGWAIHHIYDGQYPAPGKVTSIRAVKDGKYFTEAAGLVAVHPIADALADEVVYFAWLLRHQAFLRFEFDPDRVFGAVGRPTRNTC
jgi:hypothetical protein